MRRFYRAFRELDCTPSHLDLFRQTIEDIPSFLRAQDVIYVGGGNTRNLLALWKLWGVDRAVIAAYRRGTVLAGVSAGALCWFRDGITDSWAGRLEPLRCLGLIDASFAPHYDSEPGRRPTFARLIAKGKLAGGYAADDGVALVFADERFREAVSDVTGSSAWRVTRAVRGARERAISPRFLE